MHPPIVSSRLILPSMSADVMNALLSRDRIGAGRLLECDIPENIPLDRLPLANRLEQIRGDASAQPWLLRAMVERRTGLMVGHIGFHTPPRPDYLAGIAADGIELGYTTYARFRRQGFATEASLALMFWAFSQHGQRCFVLSVSPQNFASTAMAESLGFVKCGSHVDDEDGVEIEFVKRFETWPADWEGKMAR
jgi:RimJ/RimL family protein N-acetyltransferase